MRAHDDEAYTIRNAAAIGHAPVLVLCDHASNAIPDDYARLGLPDGALTRHIAYDPGAAPLSEALADALDAPAILSRFSRLVIDPNRGLDDPTLVMTLSDGQIIPGNRDLAPQAIAARIARHYAPYHATITSAIDTSLAAGVVPALISVHTFTPVWRGVARPWHAGLLWDRDDRLARLFIDGLRADPSLVVGNNAPYSGALKNDCLYRHGTARGLAHVLIEIRNDLLATPEGVTQWCDRLAGIINAALADAATQADLATVRNYGSRVG